MKCALPRKAFSEAFAAAAAFAPTRSPKPILQSILLTCSGETAMLAATDMEIGIVVTMTGANVSEYGKCLLPAWRVAAILRESSDETIAIDADEQGVLLRGERMEFKLGSGDPFGFPHVADLLYKPMCVLPAADFRRLINSTVFATERGDGSRYALGGILLEIAKQAIIGVGTDGRRLSKIEMAATVTDAEVPESIILPARAAKIMASMLPDDGNCELAMDKARLVVTAGNVTMTAMRLEGRYPKWRDVFPKSAGWSQVSLDAATFSTSLRQAAVVTSDESKGLDFGFAADTLTLSAETADAGKSRVELPITYAGKDQTVMLDPKYVLEFISAVRPDSVEMSVLNSNSAVILRADKAECVVMTMARD